MESSSSSIEFTTTSTFKPRTSSISDTRVHLEETFARLKNSKKASERLLDLPEDESSSSESSTPIDCEDHRAFINLQNDSFASGEYQIDPSKKRSNCSDYTDVTEFDSGEHLTEAPKLTTTTEMSHTTTEPFAKHTDKVTTTTIVPQTTPDCSKRIFIDLDGDEINSNGDFDWSDCVSGITSETPTRIGPKTSSESEKDEPNCDNSDESCSKETNVISTTITTTSTDSSSTTPDKLTSSLTTTTPSDTNTASTSITSTISTTTSTPIKTTIRTTTPFYPIYTDSPEPDFVDGRDPYFFDYLSEYYVHGSIGGGRCCG
jgi:hypothetical protein